MPLSVKYRAFISYSHVDRHWGEWLHRKLEGYRVPQKIVGRATDYGPIPRRLTPIFRDRDELATSHDLGAEIQTALESSMFLLVICSTSAARSKWVNEEIRAFKRLHGDVRVRAVIVDGEPFSSDPPTECFPQSLRFKVDEAGTITDRPAEPVAADLRKGGDGKKYALSKLVAGLTGARLDDLIQREQARRNARMRTVAGGMAAVSLAFAVIAWEAVKQRDNARVAEASAVDARDDAEGLVEFMLTDLRKRLNAVGRLDVLDSVGERALEYYDARDITTADADALGRRARAQLLIGEMDNLRGDLDAALDSYTAAAKTTEEQLRRDPDNPDRIFDHSQSVFWVGYIAWLRGDAGTARRYMMQYYEQAQRLVAINPDNDDWQAELEYSYSNLGTLEMGEGNAAEAERHFRNSLRVSSSLAGKYPDDEERLIAAAQSWSWLATALFHQAYIGEAREALLAELALYKNARLDDSGKENAIIKNRESIALYGLADVLIAEGRVEEAAKQAVLASNLADDLLSEDPLNLEFAARDTLAHSVLGETLLYLKQFDDAQASLSTAISLANQLVEKDPSNIQWRGTVAALPILLLAKLQEVQGNYSSASAGYKELAHDLQSIIDSDVSSDKINHIYCAALNGQKRLSPDENDANLERVISRLESKTGKNSPKSLVVLVEAYASTGRTEQAQEIVTRLYDTGYRHPEFLRVVVAHPELMIDGAF